jgi:NADH dehydrogenase
VAVHVVTGAFGFSGRYIARRLLGAGHTVRTLTNSPNRANPFGDRIEVHPLSFDADDLGAALGGADSLINTYWVRFNHDRFSHRSAVDNTIRLFDAAADAGVRRIIHVSITNPSVDSPLEYFRGKAQLERVLTSSAGSYAILRPAVLFGTEDILINNIAWMLRRLPVFGVFGAGDYRIRPIHVDDLAILAVSQLGENDNRVIDAVGPESFTYRELVGTIGDAIGRHRPMVSVAPFIGYSVAWLIGRAVRDVVLTRDEIEGLMRGLLWTDAPTAGSVRLSDWASVHADTLGVRYASELDRRRNRRRGYAANET